MFDSLWSRGLSMKFSRQEYGSGLSFPSPGDLPNPSSCNAGRFFTVWASREVENEERSCSVLPRNQCRVLTYLLTFPFSSQAAVTVMIVIYIPGVFSYIRRGKEQFLFSKNCAYVFRFVWQWPGGLVQEVHCLALLGTFWGLEQPPGQLCQKHLKGYAYHSHLGQVTRNGKQVARKKSLRS